MSFSVRDGKFDVVIAAGPRVALWPSAGVRAISALCAESGLTIGLLGGTELKVHGVIPLPGTGGLVLAEDTQHRIHRIRARSVIRVAHCPQVGDPFPGWQSAGAVPLEAATRFRSSGAQSPSFWMPGVAILGTGNRALRFGTQMLELGIPEVTCIESYGRWANKDYAGWEVERRQFEMKGGRIIHGKPVSLTPKAAQLWEFRVEDGQGIRVLEVARLVSAGPFHDSPGIREYPPGSLLFELEQTAPLARGDDIEGWEIEEERGRWLAAKVIRALVSDLGTKREKIERLGRMARGRLRGYFEHRLEPFITGFDGKWLDSETSRKLSSFEGTPKEAQKARAVASIECFEQIPCNACETTCPENAISINKTDEKRKASLTNTPVLHETDCTACGLCLSACPSKAIVLLKDEDGRSISQVTFAMEGQQKWQAGEFVTLLNRKGDSLGSGRVSALPPAPEGDSFVQVDVPSHLAWQARSIRKPKAANALDEMIQQQPMESKVEITFNGEKRFVRENIPITQALFEIGRNRPVDSMYCQDGSCGLCVVLVEDVKKLACQTRTKRGASVKTTDVRAGDADPAAAQARVQSSYLCPCQGIDSKRVVDRIRQGKHRSPEAVLSVEPVVAGRCHGQICVDPFRRLLESEGIDASQWIDWRFPWSDWKLTSIP